MIQRLTYFNLLFVLVFLAGCRAEEQSRPVPADLPVVGIQTMIVAAEGGHLRTEVAGTIQSVNEAAIAPKVTGTIEEIPVTLGSGVKKGDPLVKISAPEISARVLQAQTQMEQALRNLEREKKLLQKEAATPEKVKSLKEMYTIAEAAHREALTMQSYTTIAAPFDGVITNKIASTGDLATPGTPLLLMEDSNDLQVVASVPEGLILGIQQGDVFAIHVPVADLDLQGVAAEIAPAADPLSRTATVKINIDPEPLLRSGQFARVIIPGNMKESLFVPSAAVHTFGQMKKIFVISDNRAHLRLVRTGAVVAGKIEILAGLEPGEEIAVTSSSDLIDGQPVKTVQ